MKILLIGQMTLHWGRLENGNIGNYYIIEPFVRELHRVFPNCEIFTTFQLSDEFCIKEKVARLPMELYYAWDDNEYLNNTLKEFAIAEVYNKTDQLFGETPFIKEVKKADLVVDLSGDIWSKNADFVGENRFVIGLLKDRIAQLLRKKTIMLAGSPTPFGSNNHKLTKEVYEGFDLVTNREKVSTENIKELGFDISKTKSYACPAFIFEPGEQEEIKSLIKKYHLTEESGIKTGFILCGWNLLKGPYDRENIEDNELTNYVELIEDHIKSKGATVYLMSHSNGFDLPPNFQLKHGRDFPLVKQLYEIIKRRNKIDLEKMFLVEEVLNPKKTKALIGNFDMLISGRIHAAVAALSQCIPTVILDYGHEPKAHKLLGFAKNAGVERFFVDPQNKIELFEKVEECRSNIQTLREELEKKMIEIRKIIKESFDIIKEYI
jgi:colanic acid/amylovoran biosynthesis protein WcaK/AmsJ